MLYQICLCKVKSIGEICKFPPVKKCWGCLGCLALLSLANITETQYLIFLKELSHGFKKPIQALLHTPAPNTQRCVLHTYLCPLLSILLNIHFPRMPSWHKNMQLEARSRCSIASLQGRQFTPAETLTHIYLLNLGHSIILCAHLQKPDPVDYITVLKPARKTHLEFIPTECIIRSLPLLCTRGKEGRRGCNFSLFFLRGVM